MAELGKVDRDGLIAGDYPTKTEGITIVGPAAFLRGDVVGEKTDGGYALVDSTQSDGSEKPVGIICDAISVEAADTAASVMYIKGEFAKHALRFGGTDTVDTHKRRMTEIGLLVKETKVEGGAY